jgi:hypothetical protein
MPAPAGVCVSDDCETPISTCVCDMRDGMGECMAAHVECDCPVCGRSMPGGGSRVSPASLSNIRAWIAAGANP